MKKVILFLFVIGIMLITFIFRDDLYNLYRTHFIQEEKKVTLTAKNNYTKNDNFSFVQITNNFKPTTKQDILNIYYTLLNSGSKNFDFYCPSTYESCIPDVIDIANDQTLLSSINNYVHPFNSFKHIETIYDNYGKVTISITPTYQESDIKILNEKVKSIEQELWNDTMSIEDEIKAAHNYIINHSKYDSNRSDQNVVSYRSEIAYGPLLQGYSLCGGYTDAMALFLHDLNLPNYKISSENHIWNGVYVNNQWLHLDLTWDDPITSDGSDILEYNFFLITTEELNELEDEQHRYNENIYQEMKKIS